MSNTHTMKIISCKETHMLRFIEVSNIYTSASKLVCPSFLSTMFSEHNKLYKTVLMYYCTKYATRISQVYIRLVGI